MRPGAAAALAALSTLAGPGGRVQAAETFQVVELRRYTTRPGGRDPFALRFETFFPEAFQQLGALALGQFAVRDNPVGFTWLRAFKDMDARARVNGAFYDGPLWREHRARMNELLVDSDDVLLLRPLAPERGVLVMPALDPVLEPEGARGIVVVQVFTVERQGLEELVRLAAPLFAGYRAPGIREAGVLVTLDSPNNFPRLPVRTDGPYLVWLGIVKDEAALHERFQGLAADAARRLRATGLLRRAPELVLLDPTRRSRLRWPRDWAE